MSPNNGAWWLIINISNLAAFSRRLLHAFCLRESLILDFPGFSFNFGWRTSIVWLLSVLQPPLSCKTNFHLILRHFLSPLLQFELHVKYTCPLCPEGLSIIIRFSAVLQMNFSLAVCHWRMNEVFSNILPVVFIRNSCVNQTISHPVFILKLCAYLQFSVPP